MLEILFPSEGGKLQNFPGIVTPPDSPTVFGTNQNCLPTPCFAQILPNMQHFPNHSLMQIFFTSGIGPDILMEVFEDYIIFLICAFWVLFNFYLKQKQWFSVWSFTENTSFISLHEGMHVSKNAGLN